MATCIIYKRLGVVEASSERQSRAGAEVLGARQISENGVEFSNIGRATQKARPPRHYHNHHCCVPLRCRPSRFAL